MLINTKNLNKNIAIVAEMENRVLDLKDRIREMSEKEKQIADETRNKFLITIKMLNFSFRLLQKLIKQNKNKNLKKVLQRG